MPAVTQNRTPKKNLPQNARRLFLVKRMCLFVDFSNDTGANRVAAFTNSKT